MFLNLKDFINYKYRKFRAADGAEFRVRIPRKRADIDSFFIFSLHKCGSTLLNNIIRDICLSIEIPYIDINRNTFEHGVPFDKVTPDIESILWERGYAYIGFRTFFPFNPKFDFSKHRKVLLVRDPKDAIVSLYYSVKYSHSIPEKGSLARHIKNTRNNIHDLDINEYALNNAVKISERYKRYSLLPDKNLKVYKYEDVIFSKIEWFEEICDYLDLEIDSKKISGIVKRYDVVPDEEKPHDHIRQVHPGNHKKYLTEQTIKTINEYFSDINNKYGYI